MRLSIVLNALIATLHLAACARNEPSLVPLGHGPLSREERALAPIADVSAAHAASASRLREPAHVDAVSESHDAPAVVTTTRSDDKADAGSVVDPETPAPLGGTKVEVSLDDWLGLYRGDDVTTFKMPDQPDRRFDDSKARIRIERSSRRQLTFALIDSSNDKDICKLTGTVEGETATIQPGQSCFLDPDENMTVKSRPGLATRKAKRLNFDLVLDTRMDSEIGEVAGTIVYHFEGQR